MRIGVPKETSPGERRVALVPESCKKLIQAGYAITVESDAGDAAGFPDATYREAGAEIDADAVALLRSADVVLKVNAPAVRDGRGSEIDWMREGAIYIGSLM